MSKAQEFLKKVKNEQDDKYARIDLFRLLEIEAELKVSLSYLEKVLIILRKDDSYTSEIDRLLKQISKGISSKADYIENITRTMSAHRADWKA